MTAVEPVLAPAATFLAAAPFVDPIETPGERPDLAFPLVAVPVRAFGAIARSAVLREEKTETREARDEPGRRDRRGNGAVNGTNARPGGRAPGRGTEPDETKEKR